MLRPQHRCPDCRKLLGLSRDMWGEFFLCEGCGLALEEEELAILKGKVVVPPWELSASRRPSVAERR